MASFGAKEADLAFITKWVPEAAINAMTEDFINITVMRTAYSRAALVLIFKACYPLSPVMVEFSSPTLPQPPLHIKEKECMAAAKECIESENKKSQVATVYNLIQDFIQENMFVPCWREIKRVMSLFEAAEQKGDNKVAADEKTGTLTVRLRCDGYYQSFKLIVDDLYPEVGVKVSFDTSQAILERAVKML